MNKLHGIVKNLILAGVLGLPVLVAGCCEVPSLCAPIDPCAPVVSASGAVVAFSAPESGTREVIVLKRDVKPSASAKSPAKAAALVEATVAIETAAPADVEAPTPVAVLPSSPPAPVPARPATPANAGGEAKLDEYHRPENFSLVYPGLTPSELAHYGVGNHYDVATPEYVEVTPVE